MCDFKPGDEVVCVDARPVIDPQHLPIDPICEGATYTVAEVYFRRVINAFCVRLKERANICHIAGNDVGYRVTRFRKVQKRLDSLKIESFMTMPGGYEEPRRKAPEKARTGIKAD